MNEVPEYLAPPRPVPYILLGSVFMKSGPLSCTRDSFTTLSEDVFFKSHDRFVHPDESSRIQESLIQSRLE